MSCVTHCNLLVSWLLRLNNDADCNLLVFHSDSSDVVDGKLKLILGLIWTLILHYSISMPMWEGEDDYTGGKGGPTPKQRLLNWIQSKIPDMAITNFNKDWNDGRAIGALVDAVAPGLCPDWADWKPENALQNAAEAIKQAEQWLNIPPLINADEMTNPKVDDLAMMTYLSQFPNAKLKTDAPKKAKTNPNRVRCYGPGLQPGNVTGAQTSFTVETFSAGAGKLEVVAQNPKGQTEKVECLFNDDRAQTYTCTYKPKMEGDYKIIVKFADKEVPKSPFVVPIKGKAGDPTKVTASGPGLEPNGNMVGRLTHFDIDAREAGMGKVDCHVVDPKGQPNSVPVRIRELEDQEGVYRVEYMAQKAGDHKVVVTFAGAPIPKSPFPIKVAGPCDVRKVKAFGRGLQPTGVRVGDKADFRVLTEGAGDGTPVVKVIGPDGKEVKCPVKKSKDGTSFDYEYIPTKEGDYVVEVSFGGTEIFRSPFGVSVGPKKESNIRAWGPGLQGGVVGFPAVFTVDTNGETASLGFTIEGPSQCRIGE